MALLATCRSATEVTLVLSTDVNCVPPGASTLDGGVPIDTVLYRGAGNGSFDFGPSTDTRACGDLDPRTGAHRIGTIVLVPSGSKDEPFGIEAIATLGSIDPTACKAYFDLDGGDPTGALSTSCIKETRDLSFIPHDDTRTLEVLLPDRCLGVQCKPGTTCALDGRCVPDDSCATSGDCPPLADDAGGPSDGGSESAAPDAAEDATLDAGLDAPPTYWSDFFLAPDGSAQFATAVEVDRANGNNIYFVGSYTGSMLLGATQLAAAVGGGALGFAAQSDPDGGILFGQMTGPPNSALALPQGNLFVAGQPFDADAACFATPAGDAGGLSSPGLFGAANCVLGDVWGSPDSGTLVHAGGVTPSATIPEAGVVVTGAFTVDIDFSTGRFVGAGKVRGGALASATFARFAVSESAGVGHGATAAMDSKGIELVTSDQVPDAGPLTLSPASVANPLSRLAVAVDPSGNVALAFSYSGRPPTPPFGTLNGPGPIPGDGVVVALFDSTLTTLKGSAGTAVSPSVQSPQPLAIVFTGSSVYVSSTFDHSANPWDAGVAAGPGLFVARFDTGANLQGVSVYGPAARLTDLAMALSPDNALVLAGGFTGQLDFGNGASPPSASSEVFLAKIPLP